MASAGSTVGGSGPCADRSDPCRRGAGGAGGGASEGGAASDSPGCAPSCPSCRGGQRGQRGAAERQLDLGVLLRRREPGDAVRRQLVRHRPAALLLAHRSLARQEPGDPGDRRRVERHRLGLGGGQLPLQLRRGELVVLGDEELEQRERLLPAEQLRVVVGRLDPGRGRRRRVGGQRPGVFRPRVGELVGDALAAPLLADVVFPHQLRQHFRRPGGVQPQVCHSGGGQLLQRGGGQAAVPGLRHPREEERPSAGEWVGRRVGELLVHGALPPLRWVRVVKS